MAGLARFQFYLRIVQRHRRYGGWRQALDYAWAHKAFWHGAEADDQHYTHIGS